MNKQERIKQRAWKYFWEQKLEEIKKLMFPVYLLSIFVSYCLVFSSFLGYASSYLIINIIGWIIYGIVKWLKSNWTKAIKRAKEDENK